MQPYFILVFSHAIYTGEFFIPREKLLFVLILYGIRSNTFTTFIYNPCANLPYIIALPP